MDERGGYNSLPSRSQKPFALSVMAKCDGLLAAGLSLAVVALFALLLTRVAVRVFTRSATG